MKRAAIFAISLLGIVLLTACNLGAQKAATPAIPPTNTLPVPATEIPLPTEPPVENVVTPEPEVGILPTEEAAVMPVVMVPAVINTETLYLRKGPGRFFETVGLYTKDNTLNIIGQEATGTWVLVQTGDYRSGWMLAEFLTINGSLQSVPIFKVSNAQILHGHVYVSGQNPATFVEVAVKPVDPPDSPTDYTFTNEEGEWTLYLPMDANGDWDIGPNGALCAKSNIVTPTVDGCSINSLMSARRLTLPLERDLSIEFDLSQ